MGTVGPILFNQEIGSILKIGLLCQSDPISIVLVL